MKKSKLISFILFVTIISAVFVFAGGAAEFSHPSGFAFWMPAGWSHDSHGNDLWSVSPNHDAGVRFEAGHDCKSANESLSQLDEKVKQYIQNAKQGKVKERTQNGLHVYSESGTGKFDGHDVYFGVEDFYNPETHHVLLVFEFSYLDKQGNYQADLDHIFTSVSKH